VPAPHPLAERIIERLQSRPGTRVLDFASGSGRNGAALRHAGFAVESIPDEAAAQAPRLAQRYAAALSTHGFLHGTPAGIAERLSIVAGALEERGLLYATFGSTGDARFGAGERIDDATFAPLDGDERGVAHVYFDEPRVRTLLRPYFEIESLEERGVDDVAGAWAHRERPLQGAVHWFAIACKR
jgi:hypothetical protein